MDTISTENINQIAGLVDGLTSETAITSGNTINTLEIKNILSEYTGSIYTPAIIIIGLILRIILRTIKEKIRANIRAKTFEKRAIKIEKKETETGKKPNQEEVIKNIFKGIK